VREGRQNRNVAQVEPPCPDACSCGRFRAADRLIGNQMQTPEHNSHSCSEVKFDLLRQIDFRGRLDLRRFEYAVATSRLSAEQVQEMVAHHLAANCVRDGPVSPTPTSAEPCAPAGDSKTGTREQRPAFNAAGGRVGTGRRRSYAAATTPQFIRVTFSLAVLLILVVLVSPNPPNRPEFRAKSNRLECPPRASHPPCLRCNLSRHIRWQWPFGTQQLLSANRR
jgi:hypothetical protein